jgi:type I restriction enzyme S subunit
MECSLPLLPPGTVLVAMYGQGKTRGQSAILEVEATTNQACFAIFPNGSFHPQYLQYWLRHSYDELRSASEGRGGNQSNLNGEILGSVEVPWIENEAQIRIAAHLKDQLATVEEARQAAKAQLRELTHLANAIIRETLAHPDTETQSLGEVLEEVKQGIGSRWAEFPVLGATRDGLAPAKEPVGKKPERYKPVQVGTVFYNPMRILIGSIAMVDEGDPSGITSPDYVALRGRTGLVDSRWFYYWLRSPEGKHCIASLARGAVRERMLFNRLAEGAIKLPPYPVQQTASQALSELRPMRQSIEAQLRDIELLPSRLLARIFDSIEDTPDARPVN